MYIIVIFLFQMSMDQVRWKMNALVKKNTRHMWIIIQTQEEV